MGEAEATYRLFPSMHLTDSNIGSIYLHTGFNKSKFLKKISDGEDCGGKNQVTIEDREGVYIETSSMHDKYLKRPDEMKYLPEIQFAKRYTPLSRSSDPKDEDDVFA